ncbi:MAG: 4'-phosphopantetheinyl transferase superfamily protein [Spirochaetes bacterium]|nr:4'-phosphopantetheinyl transferase superfamily protein [Spirochaetota bacterium]
MRSFRNIYYDIKQHHNHTLKFLNSSIAFIDIYNVQKRLKKKGGDSYDKFLTEWEYLFLQKLKINKRRIDFLCGRLAGKRAVMRHLIRNSGVNPEKVAESSFFKDIEIRRTVTGRPAVFIKDGKGRNGSSDFYISISHTEGVAASLVSNKQDCKGIGIDIEKIANRDPSLWNVAFTDHEKSMLEQCAVKGNGNAKEVLDEEIARYWSIKEAVMKSMGVGVNIDLKDIEIVETHDYSASVRLKNGAMDRFQLLEGNTLKAESTRIEKFMVSIACLY